MTYMVTRSIAVWPDLWLADRRSRYRRNRGGGGDAGGGPISTAPAEARVRVRDRGVRWRRIMALSAELSEALPENARGKWLALEEALHGYWLDVAVEHYNQGFEAGLVRKWAESELSETGDAQLKLKAIVAALTRLIDELEPSS